MADIKETRLMLSHTLVHCHKMCWKIGEENQIRLDEMNQAAKHALELIDEQQEQIRFLQSKSVEQYGILSELLEVGYPHNFQLEPLWIVDYMQRITKVITKAYDALKNDPEG